MSSEVPFNPNYIHHRASKFISSIREIVFGVEDGMVSTLGAVTGIAVGSQDYFTVMLSGFVIISVESISMGIGSFLSSRSERQIIERKLFEETAEIKNFPKEESVELYEIYTKEGWPAETARLMVDAASANNKLMLNEMAYRELGVIPKEDGSSMRDGLFMFISYVIGGFIPLAAYFFFPIYPAVYLSIFITLIGLFILGSATSKYTKQNLLKSGFYMLLLGSIALGAGYGIGLLARIFGV